MSHETPEELFLSQKEEEVSVLNGSEEKLENIMDEIDLNNETSGEVVTENCADLQGCETSPSKSSDEISLNESSSSDVQTSDELDVPSCNTDVQILEEKLMHLINLLTFNSELGKSSKNHLQGLNFNALSQRSKEEVLLYVKETFQKLAGLLEDTNERQKKELDQCRGNHSAFAYQDQIEALEKDLAQAKADAFVWANDLKNTKEKLTQENIAVRSELTSRLERLTKQCEASNREKESMVMKFAKGEKEVLVVKKQKDNIEKKVKELERDKEILQGKIKSLIQERTRICNAFDNKIQENGVASRNIDRLKEEINAKDIKIKWGQTKLKAEMDAHKETEAKLDRALAKICNHEEEIHSTREEAEQFVRETKEGENSRANLLGKQLKEMKAMLILEKQKHDDISAFYKQVKAEHETLRSSHLLLDTEATTLRVKAAKYEQERKESEKLFESLQAELRNVKQEAADLSQRLSHSSVYAEQLESEKVKSGFAEQEIKDLQMKLEEQSTELSKCREKEAELLNFTQKLTNKDVTLRSQLAASQGKVRLLEVEHNEMKSQVKNLQTQVANLTKELTQLKETTKQEEERLSSLLSEKTQEASELRTKVSDLTNEIQVQQKKQANSLKGSNREVQKLRKKLDALESCSTPRRVVTAEGTTERVLKNGDSHPNWCQQESLSLESRTSSDISLNTADSCHINGSAATTVPEALKDASLTTSSSVSDLPQQVLIDRIVKLQKGAIKRSEKIEFLEEHVAQLVSELKKKNKIIHHYIMEEDPGALINARSDAAKAEIIKHGGIMASVYGSSPKDGTMTLELSLEINRKLQAVLEDTLLKNITLKDNLNTLGDEVAKLALQNSNILKQS